MASQQPNWHHEAMVGELFTINATNIARAAVREAGRRLDPESPANIEVAGQNLGGAMQVFVRVSSPSSLTTTIDVNEASVRSCLEEDDSEVSRRMVSGLISSLAAKIIAVVPTERTATKTTP